MIQETVSYNSPYFQMEIRSAKKFTMPIHHFHESYELYYMNKGSRQYFINNRTYTLNPGALALIPPHILHKTIDTGNEHSRVLMNFHPNFLNCEADRALLEYTFSHPLTQFSLSARTRIEELIRSMVHEITYKEIGFESALHAYLKELLVYTARYQQNHLNDGNAHEDNKIQEIIDYLHQHYDRDLTLDHLAGEFYMSRYYLSRLFKRETGFSLVEYIHSIRVIEAQRLLRTSSLKVIEIASLTGFNNVSNFGKVFKSITKMTPLAYRKMMQMS